MRKASKICCICYDVIPASYPTLNCGHKVHPKCIKMWNKSCPLCRKKVVITPFTRRETYINDIYNELNKFLDPLRNACQMWRVNNIRTCELKKIIYKHTYDLLNFVWDNRIAIRRDYLFIETMKNRCNNIINELQIIDSVVTIDKKKRSMIARMKYILVRI